MMKSREYERFRLLASRTMMWSFTCVIIVSVICSTCGAAKTFELLEEVQIEFPSADGWSSNGDEGSNDVAAGTGNEDVSDTGFFQATLRSIINPMAEQVRIAYKEGQVQQRGKAASRKVLQKALWESQSWLEETLSGSELRKMTQLFGVQDLLPVPRTPGSVSSDVGSDAAKFDKEQKGYRGDTDKPTPVMIADAGYPVEIHETQTEDGYILQMHRIPHGIANGSGPGEGPKTPIYLQHGLLCSSADWVISGPGKGLAFILADKGYDVWMGNVRGNTYSKRHETLSPKDAAFWDFSFDQHGLYDVPAQMDLVTSVTGKQRMFYIGHSMGTTMFWAMCNVRPNYRDRIKAMYALAPVARVDHMKSPVALLAPFVSEIKQITDEFGVNEFLPSGRATNWIGTLLCDPELVTSVDLCQNIIFLLCGFNPDQLNSVSYEAPALGWIEPNAMESLFRFTSGIHHAFEALLDDCRGDSHLLHILSYKTLLPTIIGHAPAGTSTRTIIQFAQEVNAQKFQFYDFGSQENMERYGTPTAPEYDMGLVTTPVALFWADNDWLAMPQDVDWLVAKLPNLLSSNRVAFDRFNHLDFLWGIDAPQVVYAKVVELLPEHDEDHRIWDDDV